MQNQKNHRSQTILSSAKIISVIRRESETYCSIVEWDVVNARQQHARDCPSKGLDCKNSLWVIWFFAEFSESDAPFYIIWVKTKKNCYFHPFSERSTSVELAVSVAGMTNEFEVYFSLVRLHHFIDERQEGTCLTIPKEQLSPWDRNAINCRNFVCTLSVTGEHNWKMRDHVSPGQLKGEFILDLWITH